MLRTYSPARLLEPSAIPNQISGMNIPDQLADAARNVALTLKHMLATLSGMVPERRDPMDEEMVVEDATWHDEEF